MKKAFSGIGLVLVVLGALILLFGGLQWFVAKNTLDASNDFYHSRFKLAGIAFVLGGCLLAVGIVLLICCKKCFR
ncbi:MAG TPA: hypothetical protein DDY98_06450 [Ruminococcaceae bacterium]|nr:hypothetical protein [Oscillospiraceae bacterium]